MRGTRFVRRLAVAAFALTVAGGVLAPPASASTRNGHHHATVLAALGDSYSSGEGNPPFDPAADGCDRSAQAWPLLAAAELGWRATNLACSGAQTTDLVNLFKGQPAQTQALAGLRPRPDVVTITIGGNDAGFASVLAACYLKDCASSGILAAAETNILTALPGRLAGTYRAVEAAAPRAKLVVVGYPRLFPAHQSDVTGCSTWLTDAERRGLNDAANLLNGVIAVEAWLAGAKYVDVSRTLTGHELCTGDPWLVPLPAPAAAHPTAKGQQAIADRVADALARLRLRR
jgi:lysophospholipase L1-like esterase